MNRNLKVKQLVHTNRLHDLKEVLHVTYNIETNSLREIITIFTTPDKALYIAEFLNQKLMWLVDANRLHNVKEHITQKLNP